MKTNDLQEGFGDRDENKNGQLNFALSSNGENKNKRYEEYRLEPRYLRYLRYTRTLRLSRALHGRRDQDEFVAARVTVFTQPESKVSAN